MVYVRRLGITALWLLASCTSGGEAGPDAGTPAGDAGILDVASRDAAEADAGSASDAGVAADGALDAGRPDTAEADATTEADATAADADAAADAGPPPPWDVAYCQTHDCTFIRQGAPGADDRRCNGRSPDDLGTFDLEGLRNCPFASLQGARFRERIGSNNPNGVHGRTFFVGAGTYPMWPSPLQLLGNGQSADEALVLTNFRGEKVELSGGSCPATCVVDTVTGTVALTPCCAIRCRSCDADPRCQPTSDGCGIPWDKAPRVLSIGGQWVRVEGFELDGCFSDNIVVVARDQGTLQSLIPNDHLYVANNIIHGCDVNENIKGHGEGPGPLQGGPAWGPVEIVGNELLEMASQAVDATGVHNWSVEDNTLHHAKTGSFMGTDYDGGGIGFKNGGSQSRVRNNWSEQGGGGFGLGGVSGSCINDTEPPHGYGCFQRYEMTDLVVENNTVKDTSKDAFGIYQCDNCRVLGNYVDGVRRGSHAWLRDDCPGPRCPAHNPNLLPTRDLRLERNELRGGVFGPDGPYFFAYARDTHPSGPVGEGMVSGHNTFCAAAGQAAPADPAASLLLFGHIEPTMLYPFSTFAAQLGDTASAVYNAQGAAAAACAPPSRVELALAMDASTLSFVAPADATRCALAFDDQEMAVGCTGTSVAVPRDAREPGRHYVSLRVDRASGGASAGASYQIGAPGIGASCAIAVSGGQLRWQGGGDRCAVVGDGGVAVQASGACSGQLALPAELLAPGRHRARLAILDSAFGQTACSVVFTR